MMTSSNDNIFRVTVLLWGDSTGPVDSPHKGQWRGALLFSLICAWTNGSVNNRDAGDLRRHHAHRDVTVMFPGTYHHPSADEAASSCLQGHGGADFYAINAFIKAVQVIFLRTKYCSKGINILRPRQDGRHFSDDIFKCIVLNENVKISTIFQHCSDNGLAPVRRQAIIWTNDG